MDTKCKSCEELKKKIEQLEKEIVELKTHKKPKLSTKEANEHTESISSFNKCQLSNKDIERFSRQIILDEITVKGQYMLQNSSVLVVGAGGLGCPASLYLSAAGVGTLGIVDYDVVDLSNLHRQVVHTEDSIGLEKVDSIIQKLSRLNSSVKFTRHCVSLSSENALSIINEYDVVLDCTDNVATRYLLNDACVFAKKPLISGSALRFEGQFTVYNHLNGPCYRCLYPVPPPAETVTNCSDGGVIGAVTGVIGSLQALEAIKVITGNNSSYSGKLLLFDGLNGSFRNIKLREKKKDCAVCGTNPSIKILQDYEQFCGTKASDKERNLALLNRDQRITAKDFADTASKHPHILIDVRSKVEYEICSLNESINIPISDILAEKNMNNIITTVKQNHDVYFVCKRGNDSQKAVLKAIEYTKKNGHTCANKFKDLIGGLTAWSINIDNNFPLY